jgi:uncharacterized phage protein (TIGR02218 family)
VASLTTTMLWQTPTCRCQIEYILQREGEFASCSPQTIIEQCDEHAAAESAEALEAMVGGENEKLAKVSATISRIINHERGPTNGDTDTGLVGWRFSEDRANLEVRVKVPTGESGDELRDALDDLAGSGIEIEYDDLTDEPWVNGVREERTVRPEARPEERRVLQGARQFYSDRHSALHQEWTTYFSCIGNGNLNRVHTEQLSEDFGPDAAWKATKHFLDFTGEIDRFRVWVDGNNREKFVIRNLRINDADTPQWVHIPPYRMGVFTCTGGPAFLEEENGSDVGGYEISEAIEGAGGDAPNYVGHVGLRMTTCEILPDIGLRTMFSARVPAFIEDGDVPPPAFMSYPLAGSLVHYRSEITKEESSTLDESEMPLTALIRAAGRLTSMFAAWEPTERSALVGLRQNQEPDSDWDVPPFPNIPIAAAEAPFLDFKFHVNDEDTADIAHDDIMAYVGIDKPVGAGATTLYGVGINWKARAGVRVVDHVVQQDWVDSFDNSDGLRAAKWEFCAVEGEGDDAEFVREWFACPIGSFHPRTRKEVEGMPLAWDDVEVSTSFNRGISRIRAYLDEPHGLDEDKGLGVGIAQRHGGHGDLKVTLKDPTFRVFPEVEWYENAFATDEVSAGIGMSLRFIAPLVAQTCQAHVSMVCYTVRAAFNDNRECLVRVLPDAVAVDALPCSTRFARCLRITRTDEQVFAYTEHDEDISYDGTTFLSRGGFQGSASEQGAVSGEVGNMEIRGFARTLGITLTDLFGGRFDAATVEVFLVPWGDDYGVQPVRQIASGTIGKITQEGNSFTMEALSPSAYLKQRALLEIVTPTCRFELGSTRCTVALESMRVSGSVTSVGTGSDLITRREFGDSTREEDADHYTEGLIAWVTGDNAGLESKVKVFGAGGDFVLWEALVNEIRVGDTYTAVPGCDKIASTCKNKFDNYVNFGGFEHVPGLDATSASPSGRMGE